jgi:hypothetical protein
MNSEQQETKIIHYLDGGIGVIPGIDNSIEKIRGWEFFRLLEGGYATAPDENGIRMRFPEPEEENTATLIMEKIDQNGPFQELSRKEYKEELPSDLVFLQT